MSDRGLLESLGYRIVNSPQGTSRRPCWCVQHPDSRLTGCHETEARAEDDLKFIALAPHFWLEMDDALAKRGWNSTVIREIALDGSIRFCYEALHEHGGNPVISEWHSSRLDAVRPVYESITAKEGKELG